MRDSLWTFAFEIANFVMLAGLLGWFFFKPVRKAIEQQQSEAKQLEEQSKAKLTYAENMERDLNQQRELVTQELEKMRVAARNAANQESENILAKARAEADKELDQLKFKAIQIDHANAKRLAHFIAEKATVTINKLLREINGPEFESALIAATVSQLKSLSADGLSPVSVETATELDAPARERLRSALRQPEDSVTFRVVPELLGGVRISTAQGLVDASIAGLTRYAEQELLQELGRHSGDTST